jgi:hypothetical protein
MKSKLQPVPCKYCGRMPTLKVIDLRVYLICNDYYGGCQNALITRLSRNVDTCIRQWNKQNAPEKEE